MVGKFVARIAGADSAGAETLRSILEQTGLVESVSVWYGLGLADWKIGAGEAVPDLVLLDLPRDPQPAFALAAGLRRLQPTIHIIACSAQQQPDPSLLLQAMRHGVQDFLAKPIDPAALREILARFMQEEGGGESKPGGKLVLVMGTKGGVGTSTVAINLGIQLIQASSKRATLLDFGRPLGQVVLLLDLSPRFSIRDAIESSGRLDGHFLEGLLTRHKSGLKVLAGSSDPDDWQNLSVSVLARLVSLAQASTDFVLIDFGVMYTSEWKPILESAHTLLLVAEADVPSLWPLERHLIALRGLGVEPARIQVIINRWHRQDEDAIKRVEKLTKQAVFARLPNDFRLVSQSTNSGTPLPTDRQNGLVARYREVAARLAGRPTVEAAGKLKL